MALPFRILAAWGAASAALALAACGKGDAPAIDVDVVGAEAAPFETGVRLSPAGQLVRAATAEGLVALDRKGQVIPALADRWIITDDGLSYIFRLRDGVWPDGTPITGETAHAALRKALDSVRGTTLSQGFSAIEEVRAMAGRVVEIRLSQPAPDLLQMLAQPELGLMHKGRGSGPMLLKREGPLALLTPIPPERLGLPRPENWAETARSLRLHAVPADVAARRFAEGEVDLVLGGRFESYPLAQGASGLSRRALKVDPVTGLFGLVAVRPSGLLAAPDLREALAMAVDRDGLASTLGIAGWVPTSRVAAGLALAGAAGGAERWAGMTLAQRQAEAARRVARWKGARPAAAPLRLALPAGPGADRLFERLGADLAAIGVPLTRVPADAEAELQLIDITARINQPEWYLGQLSCAARRGLCSTAADEKLAAARSAVDAGQRAALLGEAEAALTGANVFIPLGSPVRWSLSRESVAGFAVNPAGFHPLPDIAMPPR